VRSLPSGVGLGPARRVGLRRSGRAPRRTRVRSEVGDDGMGGRVPAGTKGAGATWVKIDVTSRVEVGVVEGPKSLLEYVRLPAKRYNVLDKSKVKLVGDDEFEVSVGEMNMGLGKARPSAVIRVVEEEDGCTQVMRNAELHGTGMLANANGMFEGLRLTNRVAAAEVAEGADVSLAQPGKGSKGGGGKVSATLSCVVSVEGEFESAALAKIGNARLNQLTAKTFDMVLPWFVGKLAKDYQDWSYDRKRESGKAKDGEMRDLMADAMKQSTGLSYTDIASEIDNDSKGQGRR